MSVVRLERLERLVSRAHLVPQVLQAKLGQLEPVVHPAPLGQPECQVLLVATAKRELQAKLERQGLQVPLVATDCLGRTALLEQQVRRV